MLYEPFAKWSVYLPNASVTVPPTWDPLSETMTDPTLTPAPVRALFTVPLTAKPRINAASMLPTVAFETGMSTVSASAALPGQNWAAYAIPRGSKPTR